MSVIAFSVEFNHQAKFRGWQLLPPAWLSESCAPFLEGWGSARLPVNLEEKLTNFVKMLSWPVSVSDDEQRLTQPLSGIQALELTSCWKIDTEQCIIRLSVSSWLRGHKEYNHTRNASLAPSQDCGRGRYGPHRVTRSSLGKALLVVAAEYSCVLVVEDDKVGGWSSLDLGVEPAKMLSAFMISTSGWVNFVGLVDADAIWSCGCGFWVSVFPLAALRNITMVCMIQIREMQGCIASDSILVDKQAWPGKRLHVFCFDIQICAPSIVRYVVGEIHNKLKNVLSSSQASFKFLTGMPVI